MKNTFKAGLVLGVILALTGQGMAAAISMDFGQSSADTFSGSTLIGPLGSDSSNWNQTLAETGSMDNLKDDSGTATTVSAAWTSKNTWKSAETATDDDTKLSRGYLDDGLIPDLDDTNNDIGLTVTFSNIPYDQYVVYGLFSSGSGGASANLTKACANFKVNDAWVLGGDATTTVTAYISVAANKAANGENWTEMSANVIGNYWTITTSGSTLVITGLNSNDIATDPSRGSLSGIVIQEVPEPATIAMLALGTLGLIRRKRA